MYTRTCIPVTRTDQQECQSVIMSICITRGCCSRFSRISEKYYWEVAVVKKLICKVNVEQFSRTETNSASENGSELLFCLLPFKRANAPHGIYCQRAAHEIFSILKCIISHSCNHSFSVCTQVTYTRNVPKNTSLQTRNSSNFSNIISDFYLQKTVNKPRQIKFLSAPPTARALNNSSFEFGIFSNSQLSSPRRANN